MMTTDAFVGGPPPTSTSNADSWSANSTAGFARPKTQNTTPVMSKTKTPPNGASTAPAAEANEPREYRNIPEVDAKIDCYIKENPKRWAYIQGLPRERLE